MAKNIYLLSYVLCSPQGDWLESFGLSAPEPDLNLIPLSMRRRTSLCNRMALSAGIQACRAASVNPQTIASIFASLGGEIQITDTLCRLLPDDEALLSPTLFHNSVHNSTAGYWSILNQNQAATTALAAADDTFAMGLLEAWTQLQLDEQSSERLLLCYDEFWPQYLAPPLGEKALACALVLSTSAKNALALIQQPKQDSKYLENPLDQQWLEVSRQVPAAAAIPFIKALSASNGPFTVPLNSQAPFWSSSLEIL